MNKMPNNASERDVRKIKIKHLHEHIDIAVLMVFSPGYGAKNTKRLYAIVIA